MKKMILALSFIALLASSCKKDDDDDNGTTTTTATPQTLILGTWNGDVQNFNVAVTGAGPNDTAYTDTESISYLRLTLNANGTGQTDSLGFDPEPLTWQLLNNTMLLMDTVDTLNISLLTSNKLEFKMSDVDNSNAPIVISSDFEIKLTK